MTHATLPAHTEPSRGDRARAGAETVLVVDEGAYVAPSGKRVDITPLVARAVAGTVRHDATAIVALTDATTRAIGAGPRVTTRFEVTSETTARATQRLVVEEHEGGVACLNFASAKNPGGGFLSGALAQEEDLARRSALYACQLRQRAHYDDNRAFRSALYTDSLLWSPAVPFFRDDALRFVETPWCAGIVTSPAPNAGAVLARDPSAVERVRTTLERRAAHVLAAFAHHGARVVVLGACGCGVFQNDPAHVAAAFDALLRGAAAPFRGAFARVVFAVHDRTPERATLRAFEERFA